MKSHAQRSRLFDDAPAEGVLNRCWCEVDLDAIRHNIRQIKARLSSGQKLLTVVKANAYGHGIDKVAKVVQEEGCAFLGCANALEAVPLREGGIQMPILILSSFLLEELGLALRYDLSLVASSEDELNTLIAFAKDRGGCFKVHLKVDTGMGRFGCLANEATELIKKIEHSDSLVLEGVLSHYACADESEAFTQKQKDRFLGLDLPEGCLHHLANSAGFLNAPDALLDMVRVGILLYGIYPNEHLRGLELRPALRWFSRVVTVREVVAGTTLSYGATYTASETMRVAVVSAGYGDGLFRSLSNKGHILIEGKACPIVGRVTMDATLVDVSACDSVQKGDLAVLIGSMGSKTQRVEQMAISADTIPYEIVCHITSRVERFYEDVEC